MVSPSDAVKPAPDFTKMNSYARLKQQFEEHLDRYNIQRNKAIKLLIKVAETCIQQHGVPAENIFVHPASAEILEGPTHSVMLVIEQKPNGAWGLNLNIQVGKRSEGNGYMVVVVRPEIYFNGSELELGFVDDLERVCLQDVEAEYAKATEVLAGRIMDRVSKMIVHLEKGDSELRSQIVFHPNE